jgi:hypothetical protein
MLERFFDEKCIIMHFLELEKDRKMLSTQSRIPNPESRIPKFRDRDRDREQSALRKDLRKDRRREHLEYPRAT